MGMNLLRDKIEQTERELNEKCAKIVHLKGEIRKRDKRIEDFIGRETYLEDRYKECRRFIEAMAEGKHVTRDGTPSRSKSKDMQKWADDFLKEVGSYIRKKEEEAKRKADDEFIRKHPSSPYAKAILAERKAKGVA